MSEWFEFYGFKRNPYERKEPMDIPFEFVKWNRDDLKDKWQLDRFIEDVLKGRSVSLRVFGPSGAGKTWLLRYIEKRIKQENKEALIFYTKLTRVEPTFEAFYRNFIENFKEHYLERFLNVVVNRAGLSINKWEEYFEDPDLAKALYHIAHKDEHRLVSERWLLGENVSFSMLKSVEIVSSLSNYRKVEVLKSIIRKSVEIFPLCVLFVDEIGLVTPSVGRALGGALKELLDEFYEKFSLVSTYTATISDQLIDRGYDLHFYRRFDYEVELSPINRDYVADFLRIHHTCYRKKEVEVSDELLPFTEDSIKKLYDLIVPENCHPGSILKAAGNLAREASYMKIKQIDAAFVEKNANRIPRELLKSSAEILS